MLITVYGKPITQGSKIRTRWSMRDSNGDTLKPWRDNVRSAALEALRIGPEDEYGMAERIGFPFNKDPVRVQIIFTFARPTAHFGTGKNADTVKTSAPPFPSSHSVGDIDKLARACLDSLTDACVWTDDSQVVFLSACKVWVGETLALDRPGAVINVTAAVDVPVGVHVREVAS
jgi:crossover junction endodeoxyribonuclease RusA